MQSWMRVPEKESVPLLGKWLKKGSTAQRSSALHALSMTSGGYSDTSLRPAIVRSLRDPDANVRRYAVQALGDGRYGDTLSEVMRIAKSDPDSSVREQAIICLGWYKDDRAVPLLEKLAKDSNETVAERARETLKSIHSAAADAALRRVYSAT
jgi:HEAT repeat protein